MGRVSVTFELSNYRDVLLARHGHLTPDRVRRVTVEGVVEPKAMQMILPKSVVDQLGLPVSKLPALHMGWKCDMVNDAFVQLLGRSGVHNAIVDPNRTQALLGAIVMTDLDLIVDGRKNELVPRDPNGIICEVE